MCLSRVEVDYNYDNFICGFGYKLFERSLLDDSLSFPFSTIDHSTRSLLNAGKWIEANQSKLYYMAPPEQYATAYLVDKKIIANGMRKEVNMASYLSGFHIFTNRESAQDYCDSYWGYRSLLEVEYCSVGVIGTQFVGCEKTDTITAKYMRISPSEMRKLNADD